MIRAASPVTYDERQISWSMPDKKNRNISATISGVAIGYKSSGGSSDNDIPHYGINIPTISPDTYYDIVQNIIYIDNNNTNSSSSTPQQIIKEKFFYLKFTRKNTVTKSCWKKIIKLASGICPKCQFSNCVYCCEKQPLLSNKTILMKCFNCQNLFKTRPVSLYFNRLNFYKIIGFQNKKCMNRYKLLYDEFLHYYSEHFPGRNINNLQYDDYSDKLKRQLYYRLLDKSKKELGYDMDALQYTLNVNGLSKVPPLAFFIGMNKSISFFKKIVNPNAKNNNIMTTKTKYGSVVSRGSGGKTNMFRTFCCNRRYSSSARLVVVPRSHLAPHECILPYNVYRRLGSPKYVLCHRYPTLDLKSMTFHVVQSTWPYPCMAISTSIVEGNNADFDGDCFHVIPAMSIISQSELVHLLHPKYNIICQKKLRVTFDHDERQTIFSIFGIDSNTLHTAIYTMAMTEGSIKAYEFFCKLKLFCQFIWQTKSIVTINCRDLLSLIRTNISYLKYMNNIYPKIPYHNGIKEMIESHASRFSIDHLWQLFGNISQEAPSGFLAGMDKKSFIKVAKTARDNLISEISAYGYTSVKLTHCTKSVYVSYDNKVYTTDGILVAQNVDDLI